MTESPRVSVGLPVFNGEPFLEEAIESILTQTFTDLELIVSDNASTDGTSAICRAFANRDTRVRYYRNESNAGAGANYRRVFELARGTYFKWAAHDDVCEPDFLRRAAEVLDEDSGVVLCTCRTQSINSRGELGKKWPGRPELDVPDPRRRLHDVLTRTDTFPIWGLVRSSVLERTPLLGDYAEHDRPLLAELALYGRLHELDEFLFRDREHPRRSIRLFDASNPHEAIAWYAPQRAGMLTFPAWRLLGEYFAALRRAPLSGRDRLRCCLEICDWANGRTWSLWRDIEVALPRIPAAGSVAANVSRHWRTARWARQVSTVARDIRSRVPSDHTLILVDEGTFDAAKFEQWNVVPFLENGGRYWGRPTDDRAAIMELERLRDGGAEYVAFPWVTFWWLDHYSGLRRHLDDSSACVLSNDRLILYDLRAGREPLGTSV